MVIISIAQLIVLPRDSLSIISFAVTMAVLIALTLFAVIEQVPKYFLEGLVTASKRMNHSLLGRCIFASVCTVILATGNIVDTIGCSQHYHVHEVNCTTELNMTDECLYPSYFSHMTVMVLIASVVPIQPLFVAKVILPTIIVLVGILVNVTFLWDLLVREDVVSHRHCSSYTPAIFALSSTMILAHSGLILLARVMEVGSRVLFLWKNEAEEQRERACDIRRKNEALVHNILPPHVAVHFLGNKKRQHEELYSQSYSEIGVLFASMPNFSDFYSEESVNNQGLECLRFLNEVISDFDALLELKKFQDIIKIKTIGSTYMAASGLNPQTVTKDDSIKSRWLHLSLLVEFAFEMRKALQSINEQSFNHFVLKMGVNHGPITAGVIGARKPHYDIWGNTVNVASRMESTGKAGCIQVTEETSEILKHFGYQFEQRGLVAVKGKGQLMTYYLVSKAGDGHQQHVISEPSAPSAELANIAEEAEPSDQSALLSDEL
ncbi:CurlyCc [Nesidiocoris tenuis]|uniref:adenylate cyclase n=1 Tax=Nesidiocoris tenuis TaxID=355587 RepID=A0ABN7AAI7_9HEMI|nr:CurlyCc [Nesidiocoris tenuis]